jgi:hypothetical protein
VDQAAQLGASEAAQSSNESNQGEQGTNLRDTPPRHAQEMSDLRPDDEQRQNCGYGAVDATQDVRGCRQNVPAQAQENAANERREGKGCGQRSRRSAVPVEIAEPEVQSGSRDEKVETVEASGSGQPVAVAFFRLTFAYARSTDAWSQSFHDFTPR